MSPTLSPLTVLVIRLLAMSASAEAHGKASANNTATSLESLWILSSNRTVAEWPGGPTSTSSLVVLADSTLTECAALCQLQADCEEFCFVASSKGCLVVDASLVVGTQSSGTAAAAAAVESVACYSKLHRLASSVSGFSFSGSVCLSICTVEP